MTTLYNIISEAPAGKSYVQAYFSWAIYGWASTYNSPQNAFDTIIYRQLKSTSVGDIVTLKIYKGYIPDLSGIDQPTLTDRYLDEANFMASKSVTMTDTAATDYVFKFDQEFSDVNLTSQLAGDAPMFTVLQETTDSGGTVISSHRTLFEVRTVVPGIFTFPEDYGPDADDGNGGAGNTHYYDTNSTFGNSGSAADRPLSLEFYNATDTNNNNISAGSYMTSEEAAYKAQWAAGTEPTGRDYDTKRFNNEGEIMSNYINFDHILENELYVQDWETDTPPSGRDFGTLRIDENGNLRGNYIHTDFPE